MGKGLPPDQPALRTPRTFAVEAAAAAAATSAVAVAAVAIVHPVGGSQEPEPAHPTTQPNTSEMEALTAVVLSAGALGTCLFPALLLPALRHDAPRHKPSQVNECAERAAVFHFHPLPEPGSSPPCACLATLPKLPTGINKIYTTRWCPRGASSRPRA